MQARRIVIGCSIMSVMLGVGTATVLCLDMVTSASAIEGYTSVYGNTRRAIADGELKNIFVASGTPAPSACGSYAYESSVDCTEEVNSGCDSWTGGACKENPTDPDPDCEITDAREHNYACATISWPWWQCQTEWVAPCVTFHKAYCKQQGLFLCKCKDPYGDPHQRGVHLAKKAGSD